MKLIQVIMTMTKKKYEEDIEENGNFLKKVVKNIIFLKNKNTFYFITF